MNDFIDLLKEMTVDGCLHKNSDSCHAESRLLSVHKAAIAQAVKVEREWFTKKVNELPELGSVLAGTVERTVVLAILGVRHTHEEKYDGFKLLDECKQCGRDLRDEVHTEGRS